MHESGVELLSQSQTSHRIGSCRQGAQQHEYQPTRMNSHRLTAALQSIG
jgi:hypothetical protein